MRAWSFAVVLLVSCARSGLPIDVESTVDGGSGTGMDAGLDGSVRMAPKCPTPGSPIGFPPGCEEVLCACDTEAFSNCNWDCWSKVACQVATCNNNPTRIECAEGCESATPAELRLGRCYESSSACTQGRGRRP